MGFLDKLFGGNNIKTENSFAATNASNLDYIQSKPDKKVSKDLQDLILLYLAEKHNVEEVSFPEYYRSRYGIGFPKERFKELQDRGLIRFSTATEALSYLKLPEIKEIAKKNGLKVSGKKEELCKCIADNVSEEYLKSYISLYYWKRTEEGDDLLAKNPHVKFYLEKHNYSLEEIGIDINAYGKIFDRKLNGTVRDAIWGELNRLSMVYLQKGMTKGEFYDYCELLRVMALFLEEENRHLDALTMYMRYIHYRSNIHAGLAAIQYYSLTKKVKDSAETLYMRAEILPFIASEIMDMSNGCVFDSTQLKSFMLDAFKKEENTGVFTPTELTDLMMCGLNGDKEGEMSICMSAMKSAAKKLIS